VRAATTSLAFFTDLTQSHQWQTCCRICCPVEILNMNTLLRSMDHIKLQHVEQALLMCLCRFLYSRFTFKGMHTSIHLVGSQSTMLSHVVKAIAFFFRRPGGTDVGLSACQPYGICDC